MNAVIKSGLLVEHSSACIAHNIPVLHAQTLHVEPTEKRSRLAFTLGTT